MIKAIGLILFGVLISVCFWFWQQHNELELALEKHRYDENEKSFQSDLLRSREEVKELKRMQHSLLERLQAQSNSVSFILSDAQMKLKELPIEEDIKKSSVLKTSTNLQIAQLAIESNGLHKVNQALEEKIKVFEQEKALLEKSNREKEDKIQRMNHFLLVDKEDPFAFTFPTRSTFHDLVEQNVMEWTKLGVFMKLPLFERDQNGLSALHLAAQLGRTEFLDESEKLGFRLDEQDDQGKTLLHHAIEHSSDAVSWLLDRNVNPSLADKKGWTPLHYAAKVGYHRVLELLLKVGAEIDLVDDKGRTPLMIAIAYRQSDMISNLIKRGADVNIRDQLGQIALHYAARFGEHKEITLLSQASVSMDMPDHHGRTALHYAAALGKLEVLNALLYRGAIAVMRDDGQSSPIHLAALGDHRAVVKRLLEYGVHVDDLDIAGRTPLHLAVVLGNTDMVELLLSWGANKDLQDGVGKTPEDWAVEMKRDNLVERFKNL